MMLAGRRVTSWYSPGALARRAGDAVPPGELHVGELGHVSVLRVLIAAVSGGRQRVLTLVFGVGEQGVELSHSCSGSERTAQKDDKNDHFSFLLFSTATVYVMFVISSPPCLSVRPQLIYTFDNLTITFINNMLYKRHTVWETLLLAYIFILFSFKSANYFYWFYFNENKPNVQHEHRLLKANIYIYKYTYLLI